MALTKDSVLNHFKQRLDSMEEVFQYLDELAEKLDTGTPAEKRFAKATIERQLKVLNQNVQRFAKQTGITL